jgi:hypothetical protein
MGVEAARTESKDVTLPAGLEAKYTHREPSGHTASPYAPENVAHGSSES